MARKDIKPTGFTLLEVILAISLTGILLLLLTMAIDLLLNRVDTSRSRVESAQLARSLLNQIADDLRAARYYCPSSDNGNAEKDVSTSDADATDNTSLDENTSSVLGIYGTATELRIDRAAVWRWERLLKKEEDSTIRTVSPEDMPQTVRYFLSEGDPLPADKLASAGILEEGPPTGYAGLARQKLVTAARVSQSDTSNDDSPFAKADNAELIAPEVVDVKFAYFDGEEMVDKWDTAELGSLPRAVEIRFKLAQAPRGSESTQPLEDPVELQPSKENSIEYRLFVRLPNVQPQVGAPGPRKVQSASEQNQ